MEAEQLFRLGFMAIAGTVLSAVALGAVLWVGWSLGRRRWNLCGDRSEDLVTRLPQPYPRWTVFDFFLMFGLMILVGSALNELQRSEKALPEKNLVEPSATEPERVADGEAFDRQHSLVVLSNPQTDNSDRVGEDHPGRGDAAGRGSAGSEVEETASDAAEGAATDEATQKPFSSVTAAEDEIPADGDASVEAKPGNADDKFTLVQISCLANTTALLLTLAYLFMVHGASLSHLSLIPTLSDVRRGSVATIWILTPVLLVNFIVAQLVEYEHTVMDVLGEDPSALTFLFLLFSAAVVTPIVEEFSFRLLFQGGLQRLADGPRRSLTLAPPPTERYYPKAVWPVIVASFLFALMHSGQGAAPVPLFVLSVGLGFLYQRTGRLWTCIVVHMLLNAATLGMEFCRVNAGF